ncbi:hypothetical protein LRS03_04745 [Rhizobacter sp. J219]|uniref:hypothetical protein n=1 Tax=Rhizobacter sp. J219 TaxID=2898430 RepID=UPI002150D544|nr:hypothetical protein [Rhizobacter sp. J219]MCR5882203.1 hypothetical protein [Rhizobacter sp. J219]
MIFSPRWNRMVFMIHVTTSVAWIGAVACFLALAIVGYTSRHQQVVQAAYISMDLITWFVILPLSLASPVSGIVQGLGTAWGLLRHYWVAVKLFITIPSCVLLLLHMAPTSRLAAASVEGALDDQGAASLRMQIIGDSAAAVFVLLIVTALSVYKPKGLTAAGAAAKARLRDTPRWINVLRWVAIVAGVVFLVAHLSGHGLHAHE